MTDATQPTYGDWITTERNRMLAEAAARDAREIAADTSKPNLWTPGNVHQIDEDKRGTDGAGFALAVLAGLALWCALIAWVA